MANLYLRALSSPEPGQPKPVAIVLAGTCKSVDCSIGFRGISQAGSTPGAKQLAESGLGGLICHQAVLETKISHKRDSQGLVSYASLSTQKEGGHFLETGIVKILGLRKSLRW